MEGMVLVALDTQREAQRVAELVYEVLRDLKVGNEVRVWASEGLYDVVVELPRASPALLAMVASAIRKRVPTALAVDWVVKSSLIRPSPGLPGESHARP
jgi:hypothetical protein